MAGISGQPQRWTCPSCGKKRRTPFCSQCGEEPLRPRDLTSRDLVQRLFHSFTDIDKRLLRSFRLLVTSPGTLTVAYVRGEPSSAHCKCSCSPTRCSSACSR